MKDDGQQTLEYAVAGNQSAMKQSRWGVVSVCFSSAGVLSAVLGIAFNARFGVHGDVLPIWAIACTGTCVCSLLIGLVSSIIGILQNRRRRGAAVAGLAVASLFLLLLILWTGFRH